MENPGIKLKDTLHYTQILPKLGIYNVCDLQVCTIYDTYFAAYDKRDKRRYIFDYSEIDKFVFRDRKEALKIVKECETNSKVKVSNETYYEEY